MPIGKPSFPGSVSGIGMNRQLAHHSVYLAFRWRERSRHWDWSPLWDLFTVRFLGVLSPQSRRDQTRPDFFVMADVEIKAHILNSRPQSPGAGLRTDRWWKRPPTTRSDRSPSARSRYPSPPGKRRRTGDGSSAGLGSLGTGRLERMPHRSAGVRTPSA